MKTVRFDVYNSEDVFLGVMECYEQDVDKIKEIAKRNLENEEEPADDLELFEEYLGEDYIATIPQINKKLVI